MSMLRQHHHLPGLPSDASTPSGASWCAVVRHVRRGPGDSPGAADTSCRVSNGECIVQPCPAVSGRSVNGVCTQPRKYSTSCHKFSRQIASMLNGAEPTWLGTKKLLMTVWLSQPQCGSNLPASSSCSSSKASATLVTPKRRRPRK